MTATKVCKVCGRTYEYCRTQRMVEGVFRWQDVACCPEHGSEYLAAVKAARGEAIVVTSAEAKQKTRTTRKRTRAKAPAESTAVSAPAEAKEDSGD